MPTITFLNGKKIFYTNPISVKNLIKNINKKLFKNCAAVLVNDIVTDLHHVIKKSSTIKIVTTKETESISVIRHSCLHILKYAIKTLWPNSSIVQEKLTKNGFFCDIDKNESFTLKDIALITRTMKKLIKKNYFIEKKKLNFNQEKIFFEESLEKHKLQTLKKKYHETEEISMYKHESHYDIAIHPQVPNTKFCKHFKIQKISGVYLKGNKNNKVLQRIYVIVWESSKSFNHYIENILSSKNRDHRLINKKLDLYHIQKNSPGMIFWHENGLIIYKELENFIRSKLKEYKYQEVKTPTIINKTLWEKSGHLDFYNDSIFMTSSDNHEYCIKPMNCPAHVQIFNKSITSYKDLPIKIAEFGTCHRNESSGSLHGLLRIRNFTQDDAHIFCKENQIESEINDCIHMIFEIYNTFNFKKVNVSFSTRPKKRIGSDEMWNQAEKDLQKSLNKNNIPFKINHGEGAFYGPKIEFTLQDSLDRIWQCGTIQLDFYLPKQLNSTYVDKNNTKKYPVIIHRAILGSIERFIGILLEEYAGKLPIWLSPIQVTLITVKEKHKDYVLSLQKKFEEKKIRVKSDFRNKNISSKIRDHVLRYVPYVLICGDKEKNSDTITIRTRKGRIINNINLNKFIKNLKKTISTRSNIELEE